MDVMDPTSVLRAVEQAWGRRDTDPAGWSQTPVGHQIENMTTHALDRVSGTFADGTAWSLVAKTLHPAFESPVFATIPPDLHESALAALNWLDEPRVYCCGLAEAMPGELRMPAVHHIDETPTRITLWLDDVADAAPWDCNRYRRTAHALGRLSGAWSAVDATAKFGLTRRQISDLFYGKVMHFDLTIQADDAFWSQPHVADCATPGHRDRLFELATQMPRLLGRLESLPSGVCHGDASTANFLEPGDGTIVAIDWAFGTVDSIGSDLGQLLAGRCDRLRPDEIRATAEVVFDGFLAGLTSEGSEVSRAEVELACATHLAARSVFPALIVESGPDGAIDGERVRRRAAFAEFGLELAEQFY